MSKNFDKFVESLQKKIIEKEIKDHNERIVNLCYNPQNWGKPSNDNITVFEERRGGPKGYFFGLYLKVENDKIVKANFLTDGCGVMIASGSQTTISIEGQSIDFAEKLTAKDIDEALMRLPKDEQHCLELAINTLKSAIEKYKQEK
ncbi:MAG: iron-sulfur cluster assembly scaffold protein [Candidatus Hermodarchaeota archaeon]